MFLRLRGAKIFPYAIDEELDPTALSAGVYVQEFRRSILEHLAELSKHAEALLFVQPSRAYIIELAVATRASLRFNLSIRL